jgi:phosphate butyryltransferase
VSGVTIKSFSEVARRVKAAPARRTVALVCAADEHALAALFQAEAEGLLGSLLVGRAAEIRAAAERLGRTVSDDRILDAETTDAAAQAGVALIREGRAQVLMKGHMETSELLRAVLHKEAGLSLGGVMSHLSVNEIPAYHKLLITTDGGMLPYPTMEQKKHIIDNAVRVMRALGNDTPKVGILAAVEKVNPRMPETVEAAALREMNRDGEIRHCIVEGPISLDLALVRARAETKGYRSPCAGDADILVVSNIHTGNILGKSLVEMAGARMAGLVMGAVCPIIVTSRGSSAEEKYNALVLACAVADGTPAD